MRPAPRVYIATPAGPALPGMGFSPPAAAYIPSYKEPSWRFDQMPHIAHTGWSGKEPWSSALSAGSIPSQGNVYYSPVIVYDYASMKGDFKPVGGNEGSGGKPTGIFERNGHYYSVVDLNGSPVLQPISAGGKDNLFGAYQELSETDKKTLAGVVLTRVGGEEKWEKPTYGTESVDAVRFALRYAEKSTMESPEGIALEQRLRGDPAFKEITPAETATLREVTDADPLPETPTGGDTDKGSKGGHKP